MRESRAAMPTPRVAAGIMMAFGSKAPKAGRMRRLTEKMMMSIRPNQKLGMAVPNEASAVLIKSSGLLRLRAERMPSGMAIVTPIAAAADASSRVLPKRSMTNSIAGRLAR